MSRDAAAFRTLGLNPGADAAAIEAAYRRLIKLHHPDRQGGDAARAAEINRAYRQLRDAQSSFASPRPPGAIAPQPTGRPRRRLGLPLVAGLAAAILVWISTSVPADFPDPTAGLGEPGRMDRSEALAPRQSRFSDIPLDSDAIDRAIADATRMAEVGDAERLSSQSRACHAALRREPMLTRLDQCVAFDEAVVALMKDDVIAQEGQFSTSAVTGRQLASSRLFAGGYFEMESRLDQIRARVEFMLAPPDSAPLRAVRDY